MFAREGYAIIATVTGLAVVLAATSLLFDSVLWSSLLTALGVGSLLFTLYFFRDPERTPPQDAIDGHLLLAPADGRVVEIIDEEDEPLYIEGPAQRISIFLSPLNVHVNRVPATGVVEYAKYRPGDYLVAWHPKASEKNERSEIGLRHASGTKVLFKQIAGAVARRIVYHIGPGDAVDAGSRFGIVKFGSRMDVLVPPGIALDVEKGQTVRAGETVIGRLPDPDDAEADAADASAAEPASDPSTSGAVS